MTGRKEHQEVCLSPTEQPHMCSLLQHPLATTVFARHSFDVQPVSLSKNTTAPDATCRFPTPGLTPLLTGLSAASTLGETVRD